MTVNRPSAAMNAMRWPSGDQRGGYFGLYQAAAMLLRPAPVDAILISSVAETIADEIHNPLWFVSAEIEKFTASIRELFGGFATVAEPAICPSASALGWLGLQSGDHDTLEPIYLRVPEYRKLQEPK